MKNLIILGILAVSNASGSDLIKCDVNVMDSIAASSGPSFIFGNSTESGIGYSIRDIYIGYGKKLNSNEALILIENKANNGNAEVHVSGELHREINVGSLVKAVTVFVDCKSITPDQAIAEAYNNASYTSFKTRNH